MPLKGLLSLILFAALAGGATAQSTKRKPGAKPKVVGTVTVTGGGPVADPVYPDEAVDGVWKEFVSPDGQVRAEFPAGGEDLEVEKIGEDSTVVEAYAKRAKYSLVSRRYSSHLDPGGISGEYDRILSFLGGGAGDKVVKNDKILWEGGEARDIVLETRRSKFYVRIVHFNGAIYILMVTVGTAAYNKDFDKWPEKFFGSFRAVTVGPDIG
jgi:hypothetical protein